MEGKQAQFKKILHQYDLKRMHGQKKLEKRKEHVYRLCPAIKEIDDELSLTGIKITKAIIYSPEKQEEFINGLKERNLFLNNKKKQLLTELGFKTSYLEPTYECNLCEDTGYIDNRLCNCFKQQLIDYYYDQSNLKKILELENFDHFNFRFYSDASYNNESKSPLENIKFIYKHCLEFINNFHKAKENLIFYGETGLGKTFLCNCIAKEILDKGFTALYFTSFELFNLLERYKFSYNKDNEELLGDFRAIFECDLLIIDDLGSEFNTPFTSSELFNCLNTRILDNKSTIISTNLQPSQLKERYSDRIASRIFGNYRMLEFYGDDIRMQKKFGL